MKHNNKRFCGFSYIELLVVLAILTIFIALCGDIGIAAIPFWLLFGWIAGLFRYLRGLAIEPIALLAGLTAAFLFVYFLHRTIRAFKTDWPVRRSVCLAGGLLAVSISAVALVSGIHNIYRLKKTDRIFEPQWYIYHFQTINNIKLNIVGAECYQDEFHYVSGGGAIRKEGDLDHSWATQLLPYIEQEELYKKIHLDQAWNAPENREPFSTEVRSFRSGRWSLRHIQKNERYNDQGYALCGFAMNECVLPTGGYLDMNINPDGASETILMGEVSKRNRPWGDPVNARDPRLGIDSSPYGFGSSFPEKTTLFGFCDGSVHRLNRNIDPKVLRALALPNDGEKVSKGGKR